MVEVNALASVRGQVLGPVSACGRTTRDAIVNARRVVAAQLDLPYAVVHLCGVDVHPRPNHSYGKTLRHDTHQ